MLRAKLFLLLGCVLLAAPAAPQEDSTWTTEKIGEGIKPAIAIDSAGGVHIAYMTEAMVGNVFYTTNADGEWETQTVSEGYFYGPLDIALTPDDRPFIAYHDHQDQQFQQHLGDQVVAFPEDGGWTAFTIEHDGHDGWDNAIVMDADGNWHTASIDPEQFGSDVGVEYATNAYADGDGYHVEAIGSGPQPYEFATSIALTDDGGVGITYFDAAAENLMYAERTPGEAGEWTLTTVDEEGDVGRYAHLLFDADGNPHITYFFKSGTEAGTVRYAFRDADGVWTIEDVGDLNIVRQGRVGARKLTSLALDSDGNPHIVHGDKKQIFYAVRGDDGWQTDLIFESEAETGRYGSLVEFALDADDVPHIVFFDVMTFTPLFGDIIYATLGG